MQNINPRIRRELHKTITSILIQKRVIQRKLSIVSSKELRKKKAIGLVKNGFLNALNPRFWLS
jgi:hypothetical protein